MSEQGESVRAGGASEETSRALARVRWRVGGERRRPDGGITTTYGPAWEVMVVADKTMR